MEELGQAIEQLSVAWDGLKTRYEEDPSNEAELSSVAANIKWLAVHLGTLCGGVPVVEKRR